MYNPAHFAEQDPQALQRLLTAHPLGLLITHGPDGLDADHLPFAFDPAAEGGQGLLSAHVARANPVWQRCASGSPVLVVFRGEQGYISPNWYPSKQETHRQVPTWNYESVHVHGMLRVRDDERFVRGLVARLTRQHEAGEPRPWKMGDAPADYIDTMLKAIVGIEVVVTRMEGKRKLSQNKEARDRDGAAQGAARVGNTGLAQVMREAGSAPGR
ncbi:FMN-binding negative transcriptional regulator [Aquincola tertiaricarbonis]|uniref:FMN-binding negative transcriptional regulator n=1 Tax=Aquincola tertiaricarbonis TaxID=391953 RepID=A0ABY4S1N4_AQUTE|nr:FMN-binding negative transcriptional regulator [Aquincola tertiaricarbonis]URI06505.1 FMN-binding negative transcriptional regulator [Aquincola tertiaricarbonis]